MGWLVNFLKKIGVAEEDESKLEYIHINDLSDWVKIRIDDLVHNNQLDDWLITYVNKLKDKRWLLECKIDDWEKKIITLGLDYDTKDISTIFNHSRQFLDFLTFKESPNFKNVMKLNYKLSDHLEKLQKLVEASSFAYNYTFILNKEEKDLAINPLLKELIGIEQLKESFDSKIINCGYSKMDNLLDKANLIEETKERINKVKEELNSKRERFRNAEEAKEEKEKELSRVLKNNDSAEDFSKRKKRETELVALLVDLDGQVSMFLSKLKPAFRQQVGLNPSNQLVQKYFEEPVQTFYDDKFLAINNLLREMREQILNGKIKLDPLQNDASLRIIDECIGGKLKILQEQSIRAKEELEMLKEPTFKNKDHLMKVEEAKYRLEHFTKQGTKLVEEVSDAEDELDDLRAIQKREIELFQNLMMVSFGKEIEIRVS
jgi:hypothetical protein